MYEGNVDLLTVADAEELIAAKVTSFGVEFISIDSALGRILAEPLLADRDMPAGNLSTMDGIAVSYKALTQGIRRFEVKGTQAAGSTPLSVSKLSECIEITTGAQLADGLDAVAPYENLKIDQKQAEIIVDPPKQWQNTRQVASDKKAGDVVSAGGQTLYAKELAIAATVGADSLPVKCVPKTVIVTTGDELVSIDQRPQSYQIRGSNGVLLQNALRSRSINADIISLPDSRNQTTETLQNLLKTYQLIILSGGVSKGKYDHVADSLEQAGVDKIFHRIAQKPGKPMWCGSQDDTMVFALPGNPVSATMCFYRYIVPWIDQCLNINLPEIYAELTRDFEFQPKLQYFLPVGLKFSKQGQLLASPVANNSSGDLTSLNQADGFLELPAGITQHKAGRAYRFWPITSGFNYV